MAEFLKAFHRIKGQANKGLEIEGILVTMTCYMAEFIGKFCPAAEIDKFDWFNCKDIDRVSIVDKLIFKDLHDKGYIN